MADPAQDTSGSGKPPGRFKKLGEAVGWLAALVGSIVTIISSLPVLSQTTTQIIDAVFYPKPTNLAVFFSDDQPFANQYLQILADRGFETRLAALSDLPKVMKSARPGVIFLQKDNANISDVINLDNETRERLIKNTKIVGIGSYGSDFIYALDNASMLGGTMQVTDTHAALDDPNKPKDIGQGLPVDSMLQLDTDDTVDPNRVVAAYDYGSTASQVPPAQGVARATGGEPRDHCVGAHWTIAVQGNFALWGYELPATTLTDAGRQLFGDLAVHMRDANYVQTQPQFSETEPGTLQGRLGCSLTEQIYRFRPAATGLITAKANASQSIALILNAPYKINYLARQDGLTPQFSVQVQQENLQQPGDWTIRVAYFGKVQPDTNFQYSLQFDYPYSTQHSIVWLAAAAFAFVLGLAAAVRLLIIFRRSSRPSSATPRAAS
jgi:hypothetical protein